MFKLIDKEYDIVIKSHDIYDLWRFILSNKKLTYQFLIEYTPVSINEFLEIFLNETRNYHDYLRMYRVLKPTKTIYDHEKAS